MSTIELVIIGAGVFALAVTAGFLASSLTRKKRKPIPKHPDKPERWNRCVTSYPNPYCPPPELDNDDPPRSQALDALAYALLNTSRIQQDEAAPIPGPIRSFEPEPYSPPVQLEAPEPASFHDSSPSVDSSPSFDSTPADSGFDSSSTDTSSIC